MQTERAALHMMAPLAKPVCALAFLGAPRAAVVCTAREPAPAAALLCPAVKGVGSAMWVAPGWRGGPLPGLDLG